MPALDWNTIARRAEESCRQALQEVPELPSGISVDGFIRAATDLGPLDHYKYFNDNARNMVERVKAAHGATTARAFLRAALGRAISICESEGQYQRLPPLCAYYHAVQLERIANDTEVGAAWLDLDADVFQKEFGIASMRLYVGGPNLIDFRCGVSRSIMFRGGMYKAFPKTLFMLRLGGFKPYFQGHLHQFMLDAFNEEGRNDFYRCCVELYALHPNCLGTICCSWYYDPIIDEISPWLSYLRKNPLAGGAHLFFVENGGDATTNATAKSRKRRRLYEEGKYQPKNYMFVWGRNDQIKWVQTHPCHYRAGSLRTAS